MTEVQHPSSAWFDAAFDPYIATDAAGLIVEWNRAATELLGWTREQAVGQPLEALVIPPRHREQYQAGLKHYQATGESSTFERRLPISALTRDGQEIPVEITRWAGEPGEGRRFNAFLRDLRPRDAASALQELHAAVVRSSQDAIITKTLQGIITSWNPGAEKILGYTAEEAVGKSILMLIPLERHPEEAEILARLRAGKRIEQYETVRMAKDGRLLNVSLMISPLRAPDGTIFGASKILRDITERRQLLEREQEARREAERASRSKDEFMATLSHELRTPLNAILGWTAILERAQDDSDTRAKGLEIIKRNARAQAQLVDDLMDMSRIVTGQMRLDTQAVMPVSFVQAAVDSLRPTADARDVRLEAVLDPRAGPVNGDPSRLQQVVWNLVANAIKFTPAGGKVQVSLERVNSHLEITVADTGMGIPADLLPHLFERYRQGDSSTTRQYGGLGLGLAIAKHIVDRHGGTIHAKSPGPGQGSTFRVHLPVAVAHGRDESIRAHPSSGWADTAPEADLSGLKVLVVDDETDACEMLKAVLGRVGAQVVVTTSPEAALTIVQTDPPSVLVSDIGMPGMDGYELLRRIRAAQPEVAARLPAIALTAFARSEDRTRALLAGFRAHVSKPVEPAEIIATIASVAGRTG